MKYLTNWTPMWELDRFFENELFSPVVHKLHAPAVDLYETDTDVVAEVSIPGMDPKQVHVEIENNILHIHSEEQKNSEDKGTGYYRKEIRQGMFARSLALPVEVEADKVVAIHEKGLLKIVMPKSEKAKIKKVDIEVKD